ncbi:hypothetical protein MXAN_4458 [Myxococcus xanthus DK 1622]|uniref:Uncharacterized protein n=1 Tax=Myxococcus xanthus (strain DK1622) TaxID=246197 RepID=Q1D3Z4_MYXXD|nr:hypothetical protein MXAN_4458 [Myxococcus xanthus DK 1622]
MSKGVPASRLDARSLSFTERGPERTAPSERVSATLTRSLTCP